MKGQRALHLGRGVHRIMGRPTMRVSRIAITSLRKWNALMARRARRALRGLKLGTPGTRVVRDYTRAYP